MALSEAIMLAGVEAFIATLKTHFFPVARPRLIEKQRTNYEIVVATIMESEGESREEVIKRVGVGEFVADEAEAEKSFHGYIDNAIGYRLKVAIARYQAKDHVGCLHAISLALETFTSLDGKESDYIRVRDLDNKLFDEYLGKKRF